MLKIRRSRDRLIFNMGIHIPGKDGLYIETGPDSIAQQNMNPLSPGNGALAEALTKHILNMSLKSTLRQEPSP